MSDVSRLPDSLTVASPCPEDWNGMEGDEKRRYCGRCRLHVYNLSAMTSAEAAELVEGRSGRLCVRFVRSHDGKVMTRDCPHQGIRLRRRVLTAVSLLTVGVFYLAFRGGRRGPGVAAHLRQFRPLRPIVDLIFGQPEIMGDVCPPGPVRTPLVPRPASSSSGTRSNPKSKPSPSPTTRS